MKTGKGGICFGTYRGRKSVGLELLLGTKLPKMPVRRAEVGCPRPRERCLQIIREARRAVRAAKRLAEREHEHSRNPNVVERAAGLAEVNQDRDNYVMLLDMMRVQAARLKASCCSRCYLAQVSALTWCLRATGLMMGL